MPICMGMTTLNALTQLAEAIFQVKLTGCPVTLVLRRKLSKQAQTLTPCFTKSYKPLES